MEKILSILQNTKFPKTKRNNISSSSIQSFCLGDVPYRGSKSCGSKTRGPSKYNERFKNLLDSLDSTINHLLPDFDYTTYQISKNVMCSPHIDKLNVGPSYTISLGDFTGGGLYIENILYNSHNKFLYFDGTKGHWTEPFVGDRYCIILFTHTFKPPPCNLHHITVRKNGLYKKDKLIKSYIK